MVRVLRAAWPALLVLVLALAPFLDKAFTIDDTLFLRVAEHVLVEPLAPTSFVYVWTEYPERMSQLLANGPLGGYLLVPALLAGGAEWVAHVTWWLLSALAVLATVSLGLRIGLSATYAGFAGLLVATAPGVLALTSTNMPDVPALVFATIGMERMFAWQKEQRWHQAAAAALALGLAPLARSQTILLWPIAGLVAFLAAAEARSWRAFAPRKLLPVLCMPLVLWAATRLTADPLHTGGFLAATRRFFFWDRIDTNTLAWVVQYLLTMPLAVRLVLRIGSARWWWPIVLVGAAAAAYPYLDAYGAWRFAIVPIAGVSAVALVDLAVDVWRRRDLTQLVLFGWMLISLPIVTYLQMCPKYLVPSAPAVALLAALAAREVSWGRVAMGVGAAAGLGFGVLIVEADARYAELGRRAAAELVAPRVAQGERVWIATHWGFQWYAERAGARILTRTAPFPSPGDSIVASVNMHGKRMKDLVKNKLLVTTLTDERPGGRVMSSGAGLWSNTWGYLPWAWGDSAVETFELWQIPANSVEEIGR